MKNLKLRNRLLKLLITGNIIIIISTTVGMIKTKGNEKDNGKYPYIQEPEIIYSSNDNIDTTREYPDAETYYPEVPADYTKPQETMNLVNSPESNSNIETQKEQEPSGTITFSENI